MSEKPGLWQRLQAKYWDYEMSPGRRSDDFIIMPSFHAPRLRRCAEWVGKLWKDHPLGVIQTIAAVAAAVVAIIALLRK